MSTENWKLRQKEEGEWWSAWAKLSRFHRLLLQIFLLLFFFNSIITPHFSSTAGLLLHSIPRRPPAPIDHFSRPFPSYPPGTFVRSLRCVALRRGGHRFGCRHPPIVVVVCCCRRVAARLRVVVVRFGSAPNTEFSTAPTSSYSTAVRSKSRDAGTEFPHKNSRVRIKFECLCVNWIRFYKLILPRE